MEKKYCNICGAEMLIQKITPTKTYRITEVGNIERDDNNYFHHPNNDDSYFIAICSDDMEHTQAEDVYDEWVEIFENELRKKGE